MNVATFNAYLDMVGISHKTAAKECSVDRQTIKRWRLGEYDIPSAIEKSPDAVHIEKRVAMAPFSLLTILNAYVKNRQRYRLDYLRTRDRNHKM